jgi:hypothetical protein
VNDDLERRLREYGATIDAATAADLVDRDERAVEATVERVDRRPRRTMATLAVLAIVAITAIGVVSITHHSHEAVGTSSSTGSSTPSTLPRGQNCSSVTLSPAQRLLCKKSRHPHGYQPHYSDLGSGTDGFPTPAQAAALAIELRQYDQATVKALIQQAERNGNHPTDQALVSALEFRNACRQSFIAAEAAKSTPADRVASVVNGIINPEITRLRARTVSDDESYLLFEQVAHKLIAGHAPQVIQSFGHTICDYASPAYWSGLASGHSG